MPAPSPVFASQPQAPRCSRLIRTCSALRTMSCERCALHVHDEADAAGVVLGARVVQTLGRRLRKTLAGHRDMVGTFCRSGAA